MTAVTTTPICYYILIFILYLLQTSDIAILKLDRALTAAELANVAIVSVLNTTLTFAGSVGVALGWGVTKSGESLPPTPV